MVLWGVVDCSLPIGQNVCLKDPVCLDDLVAAKEDGGGGCLFARLSGQYETQKEESAGTAAGGIVEGFFVLLSPESKVSPLNP